MTRAQLRSRLASEWEAMGWEWDLQIGGLILDRVAAEGSVDPEAIAATVPNSYMSRYGTDPESFADAIERAIGGQSMEADPIGGSSTMVINGDTYNLSFELSEGAKIENSPIKVGPDPQVNIDMDASREAVFTGIETLLRSGLAGTWDTDAGQALGNVIDERGDLSAEEISTFTQEVGKIERPDPERIRALLEKVAVGAAASTLGQGLTAGLGLLLQNPNPPF
jgi:hypothetical protein